MPNLDLYNQAFIRTFNVDESQLNDDFSIETVDKWDSILQLNLVTEVEDAFDIMLDPEDILAFKSYKLGKEIVAKHGVDL